MHYLRNVMRKNPGDLILIFNGRDGEWEARISDLGKKSGSIITEKQIRPQNNEPDLWLIFSKVKREATENIVQKATELGIAEILPVFTEFSSVKNANTERMELIAIEASEQCERLTCPKIHEAKPLKDLIDSWDKNRGIIFCDESRTAESIQKALLAKGTQTKKWAIIIGPEGGFSKQELDSLYELPYVIPVSLGPRILRADTAAIAAISIFQATIGD